MKERLISNHDLFFSYEGQQGAANGQDSWGCFSGMHRALGGWMLARAPASPAQGLHLHGSRYSIFSYSCMTFGLEKLELIDRDLSALLLRTLAVGRQQHFESIEVALDIE